MKQWMRNMTDQLLSAVSRVSGGRRAVAIALALAMLLCCLPLGMFSSAYNTELIVNGTFDAGLDDWYISGGVTAETGYAALDAEEGQSLLQSTEAEAAAGSNYTLSFDVRLSDVTAEFQASMVQFASSTALSAAGDVVVSLTQDERAAAEAGWTTIERTVQSAADATGLAMCFDVTAGAADVDNVSLKLTHDMPKYSVEGEKVAIKNADFANRLNDWTAAGEVEATTGWFGKGVALYPEVGGAQLSQGGIALESGATYELHYYIKAANADGYVSGIELALTQDGVSDVLQPYKLSGNTDASGWQEVTIRFSTGVVDGTATMVLFSEAEGSALGMDVSVMFDEITLTKIPATNSLSAQTDGNLIVNGTFQLADGVTNSSFDLAAGLGGKWTWMGDATTLSNKSWTVVDDASVDGNALEISHIAADARNLAYTDVEWEAGKTYVVTYWVKGTIREIYPHFYCGGTRFHPNFTTNENAWVAAVSTLLNECKVTGTKAEWTKCSFEFTTPDTVDSAANNAFYFMVNGNAGQTVSIANFSIVEKAAESNIKNLVINSDFESGAATNWQTFNNVQLNVVDDTDLNSKVLSFKNVSGNGVFATMSEGLKANTTYKISFKAKVTDDEGKQVAYGNAIDTAAASVRLTAASGKLVQSAGSFKQVSYDAATGWGSYEYTVTPDADMETAVVRLIFRAYNVLLDDVVAYEVVEEEEPQPEEPTVNNLMVNGDFENGKNNWTTGNGALSVVDDADLNSKVLTFNHSQTAQVVGDFTGPAKVGTTYKFQFKMKAVKDNAIAAYTSALQLATPSIRNGAGGSLQLLDEDSFKQVSYDAATGWGTYEYTVTPTAEFATPVMRIVSYSGYQIYLDDVVAYEVTKDEEEPQPEELVNLYKNGTFQLADGVTNDSFDLVAGLGTGFKWMQDMTGKATWKVVDDPDVNGNALAVSFSADYGSNLSLSPIAWEAGKTYVVTFWVKGATKHFYPTFYLDGVRYFHTEAYDGTNPEKPAIVDMTKSTSDYMQNSPWTKYSFEMTTPKDMGTGNNEFFFMFHGYANGTISLADVSIYDKSLLPEPEPGDVWLYNGTFEEGTTAWNGIADAQIKDGAAEAGKILQINKAAGEAATTVTQTFGKKVEAGQEYTLRFRARNNVLTNIGDLATVWVSGAAGKFGETKLEATNGAWNEYSVSVEVPAGSEDLTLNIQLNGAASQAVAYELADFSFEEYIPLLSNGDFTVGSDGMGDWSVVTMNAPDSATSYAVVDDPEFGKVFKLSKSRLDGSTAATDLRHSALGRSLEVGKTYTVSYWTKNDGLTANDAKMYPMIRNNSGGGAQYPPTSLPGAEDSGATNGEWKYYEFDYTVNSGYDKLQFWLRVDARTGAVNEFTNYYFADIQIRPSTKKAALVINNSEFQEVLGSYPVNWGVIGANVVANATAEGAEDTGLVTVTPADGEAGVSTLVSVYASVDHILKFRVKADAVAAESLKLRMTAYADQIRTPISANAITTETIEVDGTEWQEITVEFTPSAETNFIDFSWLASGGSFSLDSVTLTLPDEAQKNLSFELGSSVPINWTYSGQGKFTREKNSYDGSHAATIRQTAGTGTLTSNKIDIKANTYYEISYWIKTEANYNLQLQPVILMKKADGTDASNVVYTVDPDNAYRKYSGSYTFPYPINTRGSNDWYQVREYVKTASDAASAQIRFTIYEASNAEILIDNVQFVEKTPEYNLDFEKSDEAGNPDSWYMGFNRDVENTMYVDDTYYHSGKQSLYIKSNTMAGTQQLYHSALFPLADSTTRIYEFSFWSSARNVDYKSVFLHLWFYDENGDKIYTSAVDVTGENLDGREKQLAGDSERTEWTQHITRRQVDASAKYVSLVFQFTQGKAEIWLDDIFFDVVEDDQNVVSAHNDFHAVDSDGNLAEWEPSNATLTQGSDVAENEDGEEYTFNYGHLVSNEAGKGAMAYTTPVLGVNYTYNIQYKYRSDYHSDLTLKFYDYKGNLYEEKTLTNTVPASHDWTYASYTFVMPSATYCEVSFTPKTGTTIDVAELLFFQIARPQTELTWEGAWIWYNEVPEKTSTYQWRYFRKNVHLSAEPVSAPLQITVDDLYAIYVNGEKLFDNTNDPATDLWSNVTILDLKEYLKVGDNTIAIASYNRNAYAGTLFDGRWELANGALVNVFSDLETLSTKEDMSGRTDWLMPEFDDSSWGKSLKVGDVPQTPWGEIYFDPTLYISNQMTVEPVEGEEAIVNDLIFDFTLKINLKKQIEQQYPLKMTLWRKNSTTSFTTLKAKLLTNTDMREWPAGEDFEVKMRVELPNYIKSGDYTLQLDDTYFLLLNEDIFDQRFINFEVVNDYEPQPVESSIEDINGAPTLVVNGEPTAAYLFHMPQTDETPALETVGDSGITIYMNNQGAIGTYGASYGLYDESRNFDFDTFDAQIRNVLTGSPDAMIMVNIGMFAPQWWLKENPDEAVLQMDFSDNLSIVNGVSYGSTKWLEESCEVLRQILEHMKEQDYYSRVVGIRLPSGVTYEAFTHGATTSSTIVDYSPAIVKYFGNWLKEKYGTEAALQEAWNMPDVTFAMFEEYDPDTTSNATLEGFEIPDFLPDYQTMCGYLEALDGNNTEWGFLLDPETHQSVIDFRSMLDHACVDNIEAWAKITKEVTEGKLVVGAYYGYMSGGAYAEYDTVHPAMHRLLESEYMDWFCSPMNYREKVLGQAPTVQSVYDAMRIYGKLPIAECDNRTVMGSAWAGSNWSNRSDAVGHSYTIEETIKRDKREFVWNQMMGNGQWLYDMFGGWWSEEQLLDFTNDCADEAEYAMYVEKELNDDLALIIDPRFVNYYRYNDATSVMVGQYTFKKQRQILARIGTSYDLFTIDALEDGLVSDAKVYAFLLPYVLTDSQRAAIDKYCKTNDKICIFFYMSGVGDGDENFDIANAEALHGFDLEKDTTAYYGPVEIVEASKNGEAVDCELTAGLEGEQFGMIADIHKRMSQEWYVIPDEETVVLGKNPESGRVGFAMKDMGDWTSIYCSALMLSVDLWKNILDMADIHMYTDDTSTLVWTNGAYVGVHSALAGDKTITLPEGSAYAVYDVFEEKFITMDSSKEGNTFTYHNTANDTHMFRMMPANTYSFLALVKGTGGKLSVEETVEYVTPGSSKTVKLIPDENYVVRSVIVNGEEIEVPSDLTLTFDNIDENIQIEVRYNLLSKIPAGDEDEGDEPIEDIPVVDDLPEEEDPIEDPIQTPAEDEPSGGRWVTRQLYTTIPWWVFAIGGVVIAGLATLLIIILVKRKKKKDEEEQATAQPQETKEE